VFGSSVTIALTKKDRRSDQENYQACKAAHSGHVILALAMVQPFSMSLHELANNAVQRNALSFPDGHVEVRWTVRHRKGEDGLLRLRWAEAGGPPVAGKPARRGFGTRVVEATVCGQLSGTVERR
jgi:two-component sensor histidine kinase